MLDFAHSGFRTCGIVSSDAPLILRRIDPVADADLVVANHHDACVETFGAEAAPYHYEGRARYLRWLAGHVEEFPDGHMLAFAGGRCVGQLELQVPYGLSVGYVNLFYVTPEFRGAGYGRRLNDYAERYFRAWEAARVELHAARSNERAVGFYRAMGYRVIGVGRRDRLMWRMAKELAVTAKERAS